MIVQWEPGFFSSFNWETDPPILNDIETFFLIDHPAGTRSTVTEFNSGETIRLTDTFGSGNADAYLQVTGEIIDDSTRLTISPAKGSAVLLDRDVVVELPNLGSTIFKTANPMVDERSTYVWVMARQ